MDRMNYRQQLILNYIKHILDFQFTKLLMILDIFGVIIILFPDVRVTPSSLLISNIILLIVIGVVVFVGRKYDYIQEPIHTYYEHTYHINAVTISDDEQTMASCGGDESTIVWNIESGRVLARIPSDGWVGNIKFQDAGKTIVMLNGKRGQIIKYSLVDKSVSEIDGLSLGKSRGLAVNSNSVIISSQNGMVTIITEKDFISTQSQYKVSDYEIRKVAIAYSGAVACGDNNGCIFLSQNPESEGFKEIYRLPSEEIIRDVAFSPDGELLGFTDSGGHLSVINVNTKAYANIKAHNGHAICLAFSSFGNVVATGGQDEVIRIWRISDLSIERLFEIRGHTDDVTDLEFSKNSILWSASRDAKVKNWNLTGIDGKKIKPGHH